MQLKYWTLMESIDSYLDEIGRFAKRPSVAEIEDKLLGAGYYEDEEGGMSLASSTIHAGNIFRPERGVKLYLVNMTIEIDDNAGDDE